MRRADALARLAVRRGVAAARLDADGEAHLLDRGHEVALDVDRQCLQRRDVERVEALGGVLDQVDERRQEARQRLARAGRGDEQGMVAGARGVEHGKLVPPRRPGARGEPFIDDARKGGRQMSLILRRAVLGLVIGLGRILGDLLADRRRAVAQDDADEQHQQDDRSDDGGDAPQTLKFHENPFRVPGTPRRFSGYSASMARLGNWIEPFPEGIYVKPADAWVDPSQPKERALVTHGHADHARGGHGAVWATPETLAIMDVRYGQQNANPVAYGESVRLGEVEVSFVPAGHVLGSAQIVLEYARRAGGGVGRLQAPPRPDLRAVRGGAVRHLHHRGDLRAAGVPPSRHGARSTGCCSGCTRKGRCVLVGAYALGKAQRVIAELRARGHHEPIYYHGAMERLCNLYERSACRSANCGPWRGRRRRNWWGG